MAGARWSPCAASRWRDHLVWVGAEALHSSPGLALRRRAQQGRPRPAPRLVRGVRRPCASPPSSTWPGGSGTPRPCGRRTSRRSEWPGAEPDPDSDAVVDELAGPSRTPRTASSSASADRLSVPGDRITPVRHGAATLVRFPHGIRAPRLRQGDRTATLLSRRDRGRQVQRRWVTACVSTNSWSSSTPSSKSAPSHPSLDKFLNVVTQRRRHRRQRRHLGPSSSRLRDQEEVRGHLRRRQLDRRAGHGQGARPPARTSTSRSCAPSCCAPAPEPASPTPHTSTPTQEELATMAGDTVITVVGNLDRRPRAALHPVRCRRRELHRRLDAAHVRPADQRVEGRRDAVHALLGLARRGRERRRVAASAARASSSRAGSSRARTRPRRARSAPSSRSRSTRSARRCATPPPRSPRPSAAVAAVAASAASGGGQQGGRLGQRRPAGQQGGPGQPGRPAARLSSGQPQPQGGQQGGGWGGGAPAYDEPPF